MERPHCGENLLVAKKGTYDLTLENFPYVPSPGKFGDKSNIITRHMTVGDKENPQYLLYPSMFEGEMLDDPETSAKKGKHFGVYDSEEELQQAQDDIHEHFRKLRLYQMIAPNITEQDKTIVDVFGEKSQSSDNIKGLLKGLINNG